MKKTCIYILIMSWLGSGLYACVGAEFEIGTSIDPDSGMPESSLPEASPDTAEDVHQETMKDAQPDVHDATVDSPEVKDAKPDAPEIIDSSSDSSLCSAPLSDCSGVCVNLMTDHFNCGFCGNVCGIGVTCLTGLCK